MKKSEQYVNTVIHPVNNDRNGKPKTEAHKNRLLKLQRLYKLFKKWR
jgi:hypothetical protein